MPLHSYEPRQGHRLPHDPFNAIVGPRPIGWISSISSSGVLNLAPYSFFNAFNYVPPIVGFASVGRKDSLNNIEATGEFVWNLASESLAEAMNQSCAAVGPEVNEFELAGLATEPSHLVRPPRVQASLVTMECRCTQIVQLQTAQGTQVPTWLVLGEVVKVHIDEQLLQDGIYQTAAGKPLLRGGGPGDYFTISEAGKFVMRRPT
ncbi:MULTISPECIES: flavin reductase family protein [Comamonas]|uniref:Flavin reductase family protein n=1 Tax=Comamonas sediminis TaxID=1783360 RepID=A0ABV4B5G9_9BURK|nr:MULTISPECIES: flavin reductase family protein [unclassified Comamonas]ULR88708.1 flavin reductase family protein [Comamonas sp. B21-038]